MKRGAKIAASFTMLAVATLALWVLLFEPFKVTDPNDPRFDPMRFKFSDYKERELPTVLKKLFVHGNPREYVEKILVGSARANLMPKTQNFAIYHWQFPLFYSYTDSWFLITPDDHYSVAATYDEQDMLTGMTMMGNEIFNENAIEQAQQNAILEERLRFNQIQNKQ